MSEYIVDFGTSTYKSNDGLIFAPVEQLRGEIVRCRDCKHMHTVKEWCWGIDVDECWLHASPETGALGKVLTDPDGFCAWGERRESE